MKFDKFCGIVERDRSNFFDNFPKLLDDLKYRVKLFHINDYARNIINSNWHLDYSNHYNYFFLPFKMIAVEDKQLLTLLYDLEDNQEGLYSFRKAIVFERKYNTISISDFRFRENALNHRTTRILYRNSKFGVANNTGIKKLEIKKNKDINMALNNVLIAIKELSTLNTPNTFILEQRPLQNKIYPLKISRSDNRSKFIFLTPDQIKKKYFGNENHVETEGTKTPHERRRHVRRYPNDPDRFPNVHGKTVIIPATWIGTQEKQIGNKIYKVRLDL